MNNNLLPYVQGLHVLPIITDGALNFLDGYIFYVKQTLNRDPRVFEFGAGNSTLYFLSRGCFVQSVDHDPAWVENVRATADIWRYSSQLEITREDRPYHGSFVGGEYDIVLVDGRDRVKCLSQILRSINRDAVIVLDNTERIHDAYSDYFTLLADYQITHFEQPSVFGEKPTSPGTLEGLNLNERLPSNGLAAGNYRDRSGTVVKGRWITSICVHKDRRPFTSQGFPL